MDTLSTDASLAALKQGFLARDRDLLINGSWVKAQSGKTFDVADPGTGGVLARVALGEAADIDRAVKAARAAMARGPWAEMTGAARGALLNRLANLIEAHADEISVLESLDGGNPVSSVRHVDVTMALNNLRNIAGWSDKIVGEVPMTPALAGGMAYVVREPVGVVGAITPWNAPFLMAVHKLGPALAMGCAVVLKPAELAPLTAIRLGELIIEAGFPPGAVNIVTGFGTGAGQALAEHPDVNKITFTGSTRVGRSILAAAGLNMKRVTLELGGKSPIIVMPDADLGRAAKAIAGESMFKSGQYCAAGTRLFVHASVHDALVNAIGEIFSQTRVGHGLDPGTQMGPLISDIQLGRVMSYIAEAEDAGAQKVLGGKRLERDGHFVEPTLLTNVGPSMRVFREEVFGPVLSVIRFSDAADLDAIAAQANDTDYGLAAKIWTRDLATAHGLARRIQAGSITVNGGGPGGRLPFGGFKQSGIGREGAREGMLAFTEVKSVSIGF
jgi:phenylacetaldehyde dehydrogenase